MATAHSLLKRESVIQMYESGEKMTTISDSLNMSYDSVRTLCKGYKMSEKTPEGLKITFQTHYGNCGPQAKKSAPEVIELALRLKKEHIRWGAPRLHLALSKEVKAQDLPSIRSLCRWYREAGLIKPPRQTGQPAIGRSRAPHNIWEVDAKEQLTLLDGQEACYLTMCDEKSGAWLASPVFPL